MLVSQRALTPLHLQTLLTLPRLSQLSRLVPVPRPQTTDQEHSLVHSATTAMQASRSLCFRVGLANLRNGLSTKPHHRANIRGLDWMLSKVRRVSFTRNHGHAALKSKKHGSLNIHDFSLWCIVVSLCSAHSSDPCVFHVLLSCPSDSFLPIVQVGERYPGLVLAFITGKRHRTYRNYGPPKLKIVGATERGYRLMATYETERQDVSSWTICRAYIFSLCEH